VGVGRFCAPDLFQGDAALALEHDLLLITRDDHFRRIPQLLLG
jgi:predicted nucleic acid-binding protein